MFTVVFLVTAGVCLLLIWLITRKPRSSPDWLNPSIETKSLPDALSKTFGINASTTKFVKIVFNGKHYSSVDEMPPDVRAEYERTTGGILVDQNKNGIPDIFENGNGQSFKASLGLKRPEDPVDSLAKLKEMKDAGLITEEEYEAKKSDILSRL